jgi:hypothetical protein
MDSSLKTLIDNLSNNLIKEVFKPKSKMNSSYDERLSQFILTLLFHCHERTLMKWERVLQYNIEESEKQKKNDDSIDWSNISLALSSVFIVPSIAHFPANIVLSDEISLTDNGIENFTKFVESYINIIEKSATMGRAGAHIAMIDASANALQKYLQFQLYCSITEDVSKRLGKFRKFLYRKSLNELELLRGNPPSEYDVNVAESILSLSKQAEKSVRPFPRPSSNLPVSKARDELAETIGFSVAIIKLVSVLQPLVLKAKNLKGFKNFRRDFPALVDKLIITMLDAKKIASAESYAADQYLKCDDIEGALSGFNYTLGIQPSKKQDI